MLPLSVSLRALLCYCTIRRLVMMLLLLACSLMQTKVVALSPAREFAAARAPRTVLRAAKDDMPPYDGYEDEVAKRRISRDNVGVSFAKPTNDCAARLKQLLQDEDFDAAERESAAALEVLPELADVARMRGRALLSPLLDKLIDGGAVGKADFEGAYEAYRLASVMNPDDSAEADEALGRIRDLCQKLEARDKDDLDEVIETTGKAVEEKSLRFGRGARVVCNTGRSSEEPWEAGTVVALYHREEGWAPGEVVPYQVRLNDGTLIYAPFDADGCIRLRSGDDLDVDVVVVGAGRRWRRGSLTGWRSHRSTSSSSARARRAPSLTRLGYRRPTPGAQRRRWRVVPRLAGGDAVHLAVVQPAGLDELLRPERRGPGHRRRLRPPRAAPVGQAVRRLSGGAGRGREPRHTAWYRGAERRKISWPVSACCVHAPLHYQDALRRLGRRGISVSLDRRSARRGTRVHNSKVESWAGLPGDERVVIGGYESGVDACVNLARAGKRVTVLASTPTWNVQTPDPSTELAPYTAERLREVTAPGFPGRRQSSWRRCACCASRKRREEASTS